jgi:serine phosphatase RsbU (regulator of sigma subunit)
LVRAVGEEFVSMSEKRGWARRAEFWRSIPSASYAIFLAGVFLIFAPMGVLGDIANLGNNPPLRLLASACLSGGLAVLYVVVANRPKWLPLLIAGHVLITLQFERLVPAQTAPLAGEMLKARLRMDTLFVFVSLTLAFILLSQFVRQEGARYVRAHTEISLAREIHRLLVPPIGRRIGSFEFCGVSLASGDVGGDLIDLVETDGSWIAYVADVSGHGVGAGLLMGMAKSAARTELRRAQVSSVLLTTLNSVLFDLKKPDMYMTFAGLRFDGTPDLEFSVAGHLPILRYRPATSAIEEVTIPQLPLGMFPDREFTASRVPFATGDLFVILTDGLTEVFDKRDQEFGMDRVKEIVQQHGTGPLERLQSALLVAVNRHGRQLDDQTVLLVRVGQSDE